MLYKKTKNQETKTITKLNQWIYQNYSKILLVILVLGILVRLMGIGEVPKGIHIDEAGMAYDAYSISEYGTDRYGNQFPLYLENFGQGQSVMCMYLISPFIKLFGLNLYSIDSNCNGINSGHDSSLSFSKREKREKNSTFISISTCYLSMAYHASKMGIGL